MFLKLGFIYFCSTPQIKMFLWFKKKAVMKATMFQNLFSTSLCRFHLATLSHIHLANME